MTGISGTGVVALGVEWPDGMVVLRWTSDWPTSVVFHERGMASVEAVHGHGGKTEVVWLSEELEPLAAMEAELDAYRAVVYAARAWRACVPDGRMYPASKRPEMAAALVAAVDALPPAGACCDLHGRNCEPPSELCCRRCTEASHPEHRDGTACSAPDLSRGADLAKVVRQREEGDDGG